MANLLKNRDAKPRAYGNIAMVVGLPKIVKIKKMFPIFGYISFLRDKGGEMCL